MGFKYYLCPETGDLLAKLSLSKNKKSRKKRNKKAAKALRKRQRLLNPKPPERFLYPGPQEVSTEDALDVLATGYCLICKGTDNLTVDHIIPRALGGGSHRANLQCLCYSCNQSKADTFPAHLLEWNKINPVGIPNTSP